MALVAVSRSGDGGDRRDRPGPSSAQGGAGAATWEGTAADNRPDRAAGTRGGVITLLSVGDVDDLDPGRAYFGYTVGLLQAVQRGLYTYTPGDPTRPRPDLAESAPEISADGRTVKVRIREGVRFSSPVDREVTSADVKYAIERAFTANVMGPYVYTYFDTLVGAPASPDPYRPVRGIETPSAHELIFHLTEGTGAALAGALTLPISIPVPQEYARRFDAKNPSGTARTRCSRGRTRSRATRRERSRDTYRAGTSRSSATRTTCAPEISGRRSPTDSTSAAETMPQRSPLAAS